MTRVSLLAGLYGSILLVAVWIAAQAFEAASAREVTYRYISDALDSRDSALSAVDWQPPAAPLTRPFTPADADRIGVALTEAWQAVAVAQATGRTDILSDALSGVALERALAAAADAQALGGRIAVLAQSARPVFYHLDGSVFQAEVEMVVARYATDPATGALLHHETGIDTGIVTLMNESNGWRLFSYERTGTRPLAGAEPERPGARLTQTLRGVNYYPAETPWRAFWAGFDTGTVAADLARIGDLGGNAVRVFLPVADFGDAAPPERLAALATLLRLAEAAGLSVVPTLFDLRSGYGPGGWAADHRALQRVLPVLAASPAVVLVDLKNEPDLDFAAHGRGEVEAWLRTMAAAARAIAPDLPLTVGWAEAGAAPLLADTLDVLSYHDYADPGGVAARLETVRRAAGGKPVLVTEIGASSYAAAFGFPGSDRGQAAALAARLNALAAADGVFVWTLHDFAAVDPTVVGRSPWVRRLQAAYGLFDRDGAPKPAAAVVRASFLDSATYPDG